MKLINNSMKKLIRTIIVNNNCNKPINFIMERILQFKKIARKKMII